MTRYMYFCERCDTTFQLEVPDGAEAPREFVCPKCEFPHALKAFAVPNADACCGPTQSG